MAQSSPKIDKQLNVLHQIADADFQGCGNAYQCPKGNHCLGAFDFTEIIRVQVGKFGKFLLGETGLLPTLADRFTDDFVLFWD